MTHNTINTLTGAITQVTHTLTKTEIQEITDKIPAKFDSRKEVTDCYIDCLKSFLTQLVDYLGNDGYVRLKHTGTHQHDALEFGPLVPADPELVKLLVDKLSDFYYHKVMDIKYTDDTKEMLLNDKMAHKRMNSYSFQIVVPANNELVILFDDEFTMLRTQNTPRWDVSIDERYSTDLADTFTFQQGFINSSSITFKEIHEACLDSPEQNVVNWIAKHNQVAALIDTFNVQVITLKKRMLKSALEKLKPTELTPADNDKMKQLIKSQPYQDYVFINPEHLYPLNIITREALLHNQLNEEDDLGDNWSYRDAFKIKQTFKINDINLFIGNIIDEDKPYANAVLMPILKDLLISGWLGDDVKSENYDSEK